VSTTAAPQIASVQPASGDPLGGTLVTLSGSGLSSVASVLFGAQEASALPGGSDTTLAVLSPPGAGVVNVSAVSPAGTATATGAFSYGPVVTVDVIRPDDLLVLSFSFSNGAVENGSPPQVVPAAASQPLLVTVEWQPQHIAEVDFSEPPPPVEAPPVPAVMSGSSRLVFAVPSTQAGVPLSFDGLLDWSGWTLIAPAAPQTEPQPLESAIECPYRLVVSTDASARWQHSILPILFNGVSELWHSSLDLTGGPETLLIRWSPDLDGSDSPVPSRPSHVDRVALAEGGQGTIRRLTLSSLGAWADFQVGEDIQAGGGPAASEVTFWHQLTGGGRNQLVKVEGLPGALYWPGFRALLISVTERQVEVATDGSVCETLVTINSLAATQTEVDFSGPDAVALPNGGRGLPFTSVRLVTTAVPNLSSPLTTAQGVPIQGVPMVSGVPVPFHMVATDWAGREVDLVQPLLFVPDTLTPDYPGGVSAATLAGDPVTYVPAPVGSAVSATTGGEGADGGAVSPASAAGSVTFPTSQMSFSVGPLPNASGPPFVPTMAGAVVDIPAISQVLGSAGAPGLATIAFHPEYLASGIDTPSNAGQVFARFVPGLDGLGDPTTDTTPTQFLGVSIPADRAGGLAAPSLPLCGLSSLLGPVVGEAPPPDGSLIDPLADLVAGTFNPAKVFTDALGTQLLGGINLGDILAELTGTQFVAANLPALAHQQSPDQLVTTFDWSPQLAKPADGEPPVVVAGLLELNSDTTLELHSKTVTPVGDPAASTFTVSGTLSSFALTFLDAVRVDFDQLSFQAQRGQKVDLSTGDNVQVSFGGNLAFLNELASLLPAGGLSDPPFLDAGPDGVTAGYTLAIPSAGIGALSLENLAITAALALPFSGAAELRTAFADRSHPCLVTVSLIAGAGYLAVEVDATGIKRVEGSLELGANLTVDLVIVSANVHVLAGFFFSFDGTAVSFDGYLRIGGSVNLLGIISVSIELILTLGYNSDNTAITGSASLTVSVSVLMMSKSFTLSVSKTFPVPGASSAITRAAVSALTNPGRVGFADLMTRQDFAVYCGAFA
jgi:IPT/TIG domain